MIDGKSSIKTVVVLVILLLVGVLGVLGMNTVKTYMSGASAGSEPKAGTVEVDPGDRSAVISWVTDKAVMSVVEYGTTPASLLLRAPETSSTANHSVTIKPLKANVSYYFRIRVGDEVFDNNGIPYSFKTKEEGVEVEGNEEKVGVTLVPMATVTHGTPLVGTSCDSNNDGTVTSIEKLKCRQTDVDCDSNNDGIVTSIEKLKCGQN
ncbi:fibronectin type III domain-containing protein [Patescibacteria group bacterium]|nr:fibronectin type III domain-containing protein [Patescibacteria group bacterium]